MMGKRTQKPKKKSPWIHIQDKLPPNKKKGWVAVWCYKLKQPSVMESWVARLCAEGTLADEEMTKDRYISHWCKISSPVTK